MLVLLPMLALSAPAQENQVPEADLKAAFLYNFTKFVDWPADAFPDSDAPIHVGIFGDEALSLTVLDRIKEQL